MPFRRGTPLAWLMLFQDRVRLLVSTIAIAFAVLIMFMEMGFLNGLYDSQTALLRGLNADLVMRSRGLHILNTHDTFSRARLVQTAADPAVISAAPIYIEDRFSALRNPQSGARIIVRAIAFDPDDDPFALTELRDRSYRLRETYTILYDRSSRGLFGDIVPDMLIELGRRRVKVAGLVELGPDYYYDGNVFMSSDTLIGLFPGADRERVSLGALRLARGADPEAVRDRLRAHLGEDVELLTRSEIVGRERAKWQIATPAGTIFTIGLAVGFVIGVFICYQILFTAISDRLHEFATLKAIGYRDRRIIGLILAQAAMLGLAGFLPALVGSFALYALLTASTGIVTVLTLPRGLLVLMLTLAMCLVGGWLAGRKALKADPAELF